jgi:putative ABC transport system substrate-binding protein
MRRREIIVFAGTALFAWPLVARAQQQPKIARLGYLGFGTPAAAANRVEALRAGLRDLGYVEGKNLVIEFRWAGTVEQLHEAAAELARMKVDIIFATSSTESEPARRATSTIPIVFAAHADPVGVGHVSSLARPGGNMTGLADIQPVITAKRLEILKQTLPQATRFGVLWSPTAPSYRPVLDAAEAAKGKLGVQLVTVSVSTVADFDGAFARMAQQRVDGVFRGGRAFLDKELGCVKWVNCSIVTAIMPMQRSSNHETLTQEPLIEVQGPGCPGSATGRCHADRTWITARRTRHPDRRLAQAGA